MKQAKEKLGKHAPGKQNKYPDFFIIGAPKCGTTALASYLSDHPDINFSNPKEPNFFNTDHRKHSLYKDYDEYMNTIFRDNASSSLKGEGSVWYLFSKVAVDNILKINPDAKFIIMLREPVELLHALHNTFKLGLMENVDDFEEAWILQEQRARGLNLPPHCLEPKFLQYHKVGQLGRQVKQFLNKLEIKKNVHFVIFDDFKKNTREEYLKVIRFLNIKDDQRNIFEAINVSSKVKSKMLANKLSKLAHNKTLNRAKRTLGLKMGAGPIVKLLAKNRYIQKRQELDKDFKNTLNTFFREDIKLLESLINRDLTSWYKN